MFLGKGLAQNQILQILRKTQIYTKAYSELCQTPKMKFLKKKTLSDIQFVELRTAIRYNVNMVIARWVFYISVATKLVSFKNIEENSRTISENDNIKSLLISSEAALQRCS